ncbi:MAG TPA: PspC domain-containing protein [Allosphingosinicella sp.]|uniref:PspC domain-containing protein n=1 Tax=Allosphingosinicella sp. TaxID=2823234 RepID=UPI002ED7866F
MQTVQPSLFTRDDTFLGVCEGLGSDLRIHPNIFRLALTLPLFFYPVATVGAYLAAGMLVLLTRLLFPVPVQPIVQDEEAASAKASLVMEEAQLPLAA